MGHGAAIDAHPGKLPHRRTRHLDRVRLLRRPLGLSHCTLLHLQASEKDTRDEGNHQCGDEREEQELVDILPGRQSKDVEGEVVMKDGILDAKRDPVECPGERQPGTSGGEADDHSGDGREREPCSPDVSGRRLVYRRDDVGTLEETVLQAAAAGDLDVPVHDGEEHHREDRPDDGADGDAPPEDRAQGDFAEPEPVDVVSK